MTERPTPNQEPQNRAKNWQRKNDESPNDGAAGGVSPIARNAHQRGNEQDCVVRHPLWSAELERDDEMIKFVEVF
jgi:hypothetical protein